MFFDLCTVNLIIAVSFSSWVRQKECHEVQTGLGKQQEARQKDLELMPGPLVLPPCFI